MSHPYESAVKASNSRRLRALGASAGKAHGASSMFHAKSYPKKNAGTERPMTIAGGTAGKRADRKPAKYADGGRVFGGGGGGFGGSRPSGGGRGKKKGGGKSTTNIIIAGHPGGGGGGQPVPVPVPRPVPVPVPVGGPGPAASPPGPMGGPAGPMGGGGPPVNVNVPPPAAAAPVIGRPVGMKFGGSVKKKGKYQLGGPVGPGAGPGVRRGPVSPAAVQGVGRGPVQGLGGGASPVVPLVGQRGGPGVAGPGFKKGGPAKHDDEAQDKKLISKMIKKSKKADGGSIRKFADGGSPAGLPTQADDDGFNAQGMMKGLGAISSAISPKPTTGTSTTSPASMAEQEARRAEQTGSGLARATMAQASKASMAPPIKMAPVPGAMAGSKFSMVKDGGFVPKNEKSKDSALKASTYRQQGAGYKRGGGVKKAGANTGLGRLAKIPAARSVPAKTEI